MPRPFEDYTNQFFWSFKRMDNVNYNYLILERLYKSKHNDDGSSLYIKPILITLVAIVECALYDFIERIQDHVSDTIPNLKEDIISEIKSKQNINVFSRVIAQVRKQNLLRAESGDTIYDDLELLNNIRNRVHIEDIWRQLDKDEPKIFTETNLKLGEATLEKVFEVLCNVYPRRWHIANPILMADFPRLWSI